jgi:hypothetical protein
MIGASPFLVECASTQQITYGHNDFDPQIEPELSNITKIEQRFNFTKKKKKENYKNYTNYNESVILPILQTAVPSSLSLLVNQSLFGNIYIEESVFQCALNS